MHPDAPQIIAVRETHARWARMMVATMRQPDGQVVQRDIEDHGNAVAVLPYDPTRGVALLVRQHRPPPAYVGADPRVLELPAGRLDEADPESGARREALEELGLQLHHLTPFLCCWTMPARSTERAHLYLAEYAAADRVAAGGGLAQEQEDIEVVELQLKELAAMADAGTLIELKLFALVQTLRLKRPDLFGS